MLKRWRERLVYRFDNVMSRGAIAMIGALFAASILIIILFCVLVVILDIDPERRNVFQLLWASFLLMLDAGSLDGASGIWVFDIVTFPVILGGVFVMSALIGVLTTCIDCKLAQLRKGRSRVIETGHTIILGWSPQIMRIISELCLANENQRHACIVVLANRDKTDMEDEIRERLGRRHHTRIVCRTGSPLDMADLDIVSPQTAKAIIILPPPGPDPDAFVIKCLLALTNHPDRLKERYHIVSLVRARSNLDVARMVGGRDAQIVLADDVAARITAQVCRQSGLSAVWTDLLDFEGDEIYFQDEPELVGKSYADVVHAYDTSAVIGLRRADGTIQINPPAEQVVRQGDHIIAISEDDDTVRLSGFDGLGRVNGTALLERPSSSSHVAGTERLLIIGWNHRGTSLVRELDRYVANGSTIVVVTDNPLSPQHELDIQPVEDASCYGRASLEQLTCYFRLGQTTDRGTLDTLDIPRSFDHVIVLSDSDRLGVQEADARTLVTLLHLRAIADHCDHRFSIVSEILDSQDRELAEVTHADDFVVSDELISLLLTQVAENHELAEVLRSLLEAESAEVYLKPAGHYVELGREIDFYTVVEAALRQGETAIGYRRLGQQSGSKGAYGVCLNPVKSETLALCEQDRIIVLAED